MVFDPAHDLSLIERKINALHQAACFGGWELPPEFVTLRRPMEARMIEAGRRAPMSAPRRRHATCRCCRRMRHSPAGQSAMATPAL